MYQLKSINKKGDFVLLKDGVEVGSLLYKNRVSVNANVNFSDQLIEIRTKTFWRRKINIFKDTKEVGNLIFNWRGQAVINLIDKEKEPISFIVKRKYFGKKIEVYSGGKNIIFSMDRSKFSWKTFNFNYTINIELEIKYFNIEEIILYTIYILNLYKKNTGAVS